MTDFIFPPTKFDLGVKTTTDELSRVLDESILEKIESRTRLESRLTAMKLDRGSSVHRSSFAFSRIGGLLPDEVRRIAFTSDDIEIARNFRFDCFGVTDPGISGEVARLVPMVPTGESIFEGTLAQPKDGDGSQLFLHQPISFENQVSDKVLIFDSAIPSRLLVNIPRIFVENPNITRIVFSYDCHTLAYPVRQTLMNFLGKFEYQGFEYHFPWRNHQEMFC